MKIYGHKIGELYKPYDGSRRENDGSEFPLLFFLVRKFKTHYCLKLVGNVEEMIERVGRAGIALTPSEDGFIWGRKIGKGRLHFHHYDQEEDLESDYKCNLTGVKGK